MDNPEAENLLRQVLEDELAGTVRARLAPSERNLQSFMRLRWGGASETFSPEQIAVAREAYIDLAIDMLAEEEGQPGADSQDAAVPKVAANDQQGYWSAVMAAAAVGNHAPSIGPCFAVIMTGAARTELFNDGDRVVVRPPQGASRLVMGGEYHTLTPAFQPEDAVIEGLSVVDADAFADRQQADPQNWEAHWE